MDVSNVIVVSEPIKSGDEHSAVVCDNLLYGSPSTQDIFENECGKGAGSLDAKGVPLRPGGEGALCLHNVAETGGGRHQHGINVCFTEEGCRDGNCWWDTNLGGLAKLALMAGGDVLFDVISKGRPPELVKDSA